MQERLENLGEGLDSGTVVELLVKEGDAISVGQTLLEIESEKAVVPIPATHGGTIAQLLVKAGDSVAVGQILLEYSGSEAEADNEQPPSISDSTTCSPAPAPPAAPTPSRPAVPVAPAQAMIQAPTGPQPTASPNVKRIAHQLGLDLRLIPSTSPGGRIELSDLRHWLHTLIASAAQPSAGGSTPGAPARKPPLPFEKWGPIRRERLTEIRKAISRHMVDSKNSQPHVTQFETVDITDLENLRKQHAGKWKEASTPLTLTVLAVRACVAALQKHPIFNASVDETSQEIVYKDYFNIGIATDTEHGLVVPVIKDAHARSLVDIAHAIPKLASQARSRKLSKDDMTGGTFTISNQGGIGGGHFTPVINRPESAILGIGRGQWQAAVIDGEIIPRLMLPLTVSYDHRTIDGGTAVRFILDLIAALKGYTDKDLQYPSE